MESVTCCPSSRKRRCTLPAKQSQMLCNTVANLLIFAYNCTVTNCWFCSSNIHKAWWAGLALQITYTAASGGPNQIKVALCLLLYSCDNACFESIANVCKCHFFGAQFHLSINPPPQKKSLSIIWEAEDIAQLSFSTSTFRAFSSNYFARTVQPERKVSLSALSETSPLSVRGWKRFGEHRFAKGLMEQI